MLTFAELESKFKLATNWRQSIKLDHNTYAHYCTTYIDIELHGNVIAKLFQSGNIQVFPYCYLDDRGRVSVTTQRRLKSFGWGNFFSEGDTLFFSRRINHERKQVYRLNVEEGDVLYPVSGGYELTPKTLMTEVGTLEEMLRDLRGVSSLLDNLSSITIDIKSSGTKTVRYLNPLLNHYKPYSKDGTETRICIESGAKELTPLGLLGLLNSLSPIARQVYEKESAKANKKIS
jgi:hypothetical protein